MRTENFPKHVLVLASSAPSLLNFRGPLLREILSRGYKVSVGAPDIEALLRRKLEALGVSVYQTPLKRNNTSMFGDLQYHATLFRLIRQLQPDLVLTYTIKPNIWGAFAARRAGITAFALVSGLGFAFINAGNRSWKNRISAALARRLYRGATRYNCKVIFQNPDDPRDFLAAGCLKDPDKIELVNGSGVDLEHFSPVPPVAAPVFLMIARLLKSKGVMEYLEAARSIRTHCPKARFILVGPRDGGPDAIDGETIESWLEEKIVEYLGPAEDVRPLISEAAVYVLPSYREGTPRSVLEAMAMGRPIITTDAPGCRETVKDGVNGYLVPVKDSEALAAAMMRFIEEPSLIAKMGERSHEIARDKYDVRKVNARMLEIMGI